MLVLLIINIIVILKIIKKKILELVISIMFQKNKLKNLNLYIEA